MCSSTIFPSSSPFPGKFSIARNRCYAPGFPENFRLIAFKVNILQTNNAQSYKQRLLQVMNSNPESSRKQGFGSSNIAVSGISSTRCAARKDDTSGDGGFQWRRKSEIPELHHGPSSSSPSSSPSYKSSTNENGNTRSFPQKSSASDNRRQGQGRGRSGGSFKGRSFSAGRGTSSRNRTFSSNVDEDAGRNYVANGSLEGKRKKPPKIREQVRITSPIGSDPKVAILGGGMSGLMCALTLQEKGIRSTVFDTGKHGLGGRMGTRHVAQVNGHELAFDHAAQYFTATDPRFKKLVKKWIIEGAVKEWNGVVGTLDKGGMFTELKSPTKYIATHGMRLLADHLAAERKLMDVVRPCWISRLNEHGGMWHLSEYEKDRGEFDIVVIAHNGKCANRLLGPIGVPLVAKQMKRLELSSIWALMAAFEQPLPAPVSYSGSGQVEGAFVRDFDSLSWMGNNTAKLQPQQKSGPYCWTFLSTAKYGKKNKVPQESIPTVRAERVKREMLQGVEKALGLEEASLPTPVYMKVQLWGAANPTNSPHIPCIFDAHGRVGICGDWLLGSNLEAAALSGMAMADHIYAYCERKGFGAEEFSVGLEEVLLPVGGHDIGQFDGHELAKAVDPELLAAV